MQLQMFDPRSAPTATAEMLDDAGLRRAIGRMRCGEDGAWPYVERLVEIDGRPAWLVDDEGQRYVVVRGMIWQPDELAFATERLRTAAMAAFERLDKFEKKGEAA